MDRVVAAVNKVLRRGLEAPEIRHVMPLTSLTDMRLGMRRTDVVGYGSVSSPQHFLKNLKTELARQNLVPNDGRYVGFGEVGKNAIQVHDPKRKGALYRVSIDRAVGRRGHLVTISRQRIRDLTTSFVHSLERTPEHQRLVDTLMPPTRRRELRRQGRLGKQL